MTKIFLLAMKWSLWDKEGLGEVNMADTQQNIPEKKKLPGWAKLLIIFAVIAVVGLTVLSIGVGLVGYFFTSKTAGKLVETGIEKVIEMQAEKEGKKADIDFSVDSKEGGFEIKDKESGQKFSLSAGKELPSDFPKDVPVIPDAKIVSSMVMGPIVMVAFETDKNLAEVITNYTAEIIGKGWSQNNEANMGNMMMKAFGKDNRSISLQGEEKDGKSTVNLSIMNEGQ
ncbi:MAG: hypothetical protein A3G32_06840 [Deltaproteobacteria bacterium RIFCSPLOWO2_12_FULL_40_28]|nr:MAG: hypothetical protein A3C45_06885 [Deltaproteobacteria bacterium RIFCSPHIGHO2_02_FULL_40_28]OGQ19325.1 MAG: hypothetical protein A3E27_04930 [Deltaproteobacteria bacterium RIFCSPHIGHO2_12_FULL_40_32]OGQ40451.1 MAG: hypothetical protein A3I69_00140 [Deltaproteobacteria bacterium RIFCSPLOWO2_02_FULL_40_36]OGQ53687.1 MAG: hypothetical protein A3G32_06840 [Deltaproteobacteria bacterium RIFCSPLOWO2_12_FULL_40_28]